MIGSWYERRVLPHLIDCACGMKAIDRERARIVPRARGEVLEIGIGTGLNLAHYRAEQITRLCGLDPSLALHDIAADRLQRSGLELELIPLSAERIPVPDRQFDSVVCTFTLCTIPDPLAALAELRRVLKPGGELLFSEHGLSPDAGVERWQHWLTPVWKPFAGGCHLDRDMPALLADGGFDIVELDQHYVTGPRPMTWISTGVARPRPFAGTVA